MSKEDNREKVRKALVELSIIEANFSITSDLVKILCHKYVNKDSKTKYLRTKNQRLRAYARHYNFILIDLLAIKYERLGSARNIKEGFVYCVKDPAHPKYIKIGSSIDVKRRVSQYQTYSPERDIYLIGWFFSYDRLAAEKSILEKFDRKREWVLAEEQEISKLFIHMKNKNNIMQV